MGGACCLGSGRLEKLGAWGLLSGQVWLQQSQGRSKSFWGSSLEADLDGSLGMEVVGTCSEGPSRGRGVGEGPREVWPQPDPRWALGHELHQPCRALGWAPHPHLWQPAPHSTGRLHQSRLPRVSQGSTYPTLPAPPELRGALAPAACRLAPGPDCPPPSVSLLPASACQWTARPALAAVRDFGRPELRGTLSMLHAFVSTVYLAKLSYQVQPVISRYLGSEAIRKAAREFIRSA